MNLYDANNTHLHTVKQLITSCRYWRTATFVAELQQTYSIVRIAFILVASKLNLR